MLKRAQLTVVNKLIKEIESSPDDEDLRPLTREIKQVYRLKRKIEKNKSYVDYTKDVKKIAELCNSKILQTYKTKRLKKDGSKINIHIDSSFSSSQESAFILNEFIFLTSTL